MDLRRVVSRDARTSSSISWSWMLMGRWDGVLDFEFLLAVFANSSDVKAMIQKIGKGAVCWSAHSPFVISARLRISK